MRIPQLLSVQPALNKRRVSVFEVRGAACSYGTYDTGVHTVSAFPRTRSSNYVAHSL